MSAPGPERRRRRPWSLGRRTEDRKWPRHLRDLWLTVISGVLVVALSNIGAETNNRIGAIQAQRRQSVLGNCQAQNQRHDATIRRLDVELAMAEAHASRARVAEIRASRAFTIALIDTLAPKQDCQAVVRNALTTGPRATLGPRLRR